MTAWNETVSNKSNNFSFVWRNKYDFLENFTKMIQPLDKPVFTFPVTQEQRIRKKCPQAETKLLV